MILETIGIAILVLLAVLVVASGVLMGARLRKAPK